MQRIRARLDPIKANGRPRMDPAAAKKAEQEMREVGRVLDLARLNRRPGIITPIIFSLSRQASAEDLSAATRVRFDLDGSGEARSWRWVRPETAILVWDPMEPARSSLAGSCLEP